MSLPSGWLRILCPAFQSLRCNRLFLGLGSSIEAKISLKKGSMFDRSGFVSGFSNGFVFGSIRQTSTPKLKMSNLDCTCLSSRTLAVQSLWRNRPSSKLHDSSRISAIRSPQAWCSPSSQWRALWPDVIDRNLLVMNSRQSRKELVGRREHGSLAKSIGSEEIGQRFAAENSITEYNQHLFSKNSEICDIRVVHVLHFPHLLLESHELFGFDFLVDCLDYTFSLGVQLGTEYCSPQIPLQRTLSSWNLPI